MRRVRRGEVSAVGIAGAALLGFLLDALFGDMRGVPHPVLWLGKLIYALERLLRARLPKTRRGELLGGAALLFLTTGAAFVIPLGLLVLARRVHIVIWFALEAFFVVSSSPRARWATRGSAYTARSGARS
jgi:adenosylcobinamide-phosphate synthase